MIKGERLIFSTGNTAHNVGERRIHCNEVESVKNGDYPTGYGNEHWSALRVDGRRKPRRMPGPDCMIRLGNINVGPSICAVGGERRRGEGLVGDERNITCEATVFEVCTDKIRIRMIWTAQHQAKNFVVLEGHPTRQKPDMELGVRVPTSGIDEVGWETYNGYMRTDTVA